MSAWDYQRLVHAKATWDKAKRDLPLETSKAKDTPRSTSTEMTGRPERGKPPPIRKDGTGPQILP